MVIITTITAATATGSSVASIPNTITITTNPLSSSTLPTTINSNDNGLNTNLNTDTTTATTTTNITTTTTTGAATMFARARAGGVTTNNTPTTTTTTNTFNNRRRNSPRHVILSVPDALDYMDKYSFGCLCIPVWPATKVIAWSYLVVNLTCSYFSICLLASSNQITPVLNNTFISHASFVTLACYLIKSFSALLLLYAMKCTKPSYVLLFFAILMLDYLKAFYEWYQELTSDSSMKDFSLTYSTVILVGKSLIQYIIWRCYVYLTVKETSILDDIDPVPIFSRSAMFDEEERELPMEQMLRVHMIRYGGGVDFPLPPPPPPPPPPLPPVVPPSMFVSSLLRNNVTRGGGGGGAAISNSILTNLGCSSSSSSRTGGGPRGPNGGNLIAMSSTSSSSSETLEMNRGIITTTTTTTTATTPITMMPDLACPPPSYEEAIGMSSNPPQKLAPPDYMTAISTSDTLQPQPQPPQPQSQQSYLTDDSTLNSTPTTEPE